ncbi:class I SAM-dependent methyltransferase [Persephonella sp.]|uniref:class I SAM-dependent methyltransferase n=1 Tax=Persephonella sp. TaxID=2060922 RepID=UPI00261009D4|nr:class I SAM-dependent methyltransferase [Persephonella sp.]
MIKEKIIEKFLSQINQNQDKIIGIQLPSGKIISSSKPDYLIKFKTETALNNVLKDIEMGFGEGYMNGDIEIEGDLEEILKRGFYLANQMEKNKATTLIKNIFRWSVSRDKENIQYHYDIGDDFYKLFLDDSMTYSCAFFESPDMSLEDAQKLKRKIIYDKLQLNENDTLLDIGCGWGSIILESAERYGLKAVGITLSENQYKHVKEEIKNRNLEDRVEVYLMHYTQLPDLNKKFTKVVSVGMFEHVGREHYRDFFDKVYQVLDKGGLFLLHTIGKMHTDTQSRWIRKYIFPGGYLPSISEIMDSLCSFQFKYFLVDFDNWRMHYYYTLKKWRENFWKNIDKIREMFDEKFIRMWDLYLIASAVSFWVGSNYVFQILLSKGVVNDYPVIERKFIPLAQEKFDLQHN